MTITSDTIKKAFAPITQVKTTEPVGVDLEKVTKAFSDEIATFADSEDPMAGIDALEATVVKFEQMLDAATTGEDGSVVVTGKSTEFAKGFAPDAPEPKAEVTAEPNPGLTIQAKSDEEKAADQKKADEEKAKAEKAKAEETAKEADAEETAKADDAEDLSDDITWEKDLAPSQTPTMRSERMTKGERIIPARKGGRSATKKAADAREKALARRDSGERTLS